MHELAERYLRVSLPVCPLFPFGNSNLSLFCLHLLLESKVLGLDILHLLLVFPALKAFCFPLPLHFFDSSLLHGSLDAGIRQQLLRETQLPHPLGQVLSRVLRIHRDGCFLVILGIHNLVGRPATCSALSFPTYALVSLVRMPLISVPQELECRPEVRPILPLGAFGQVKPIRTRSLVGLISFPNLSDRCTVFIVHLKELGKGRIPELRSLSNVATNLRNHWHVLSLLAQRFRGLRFPNDAAQIIDSITPLLLQVLFEGFSTPHRQLQSADPPHQRMHMP
mmetsp:Transcript_6734/g.10635  ORF Transcript_6734/g.10635 Transcript_6734/m.10635 type:complete len:280 (-) Transcript_6734:102-941(-)